MSSPLQAWFKGTDDCLWTFAFLMSVLAFASAAHAQSGLQETPDGRRVVVSKDVGAERWAITLNKDDGSATGNVFFPEGGEPLFVWCQSSGVTAEDDAAFDCFGADACPYGSCGDAHWSFIAEVALPVAFFEPPEASTTTASLGRVAGGVADRESGAQITPDAKRTLVSKDVGGERWAIARNHDDGTVTGNVFKPGGSEPQFVWCEEVSSTEDEATYRCLGADVCSAGPCLPSQWTTVVEAVTLPKGFFAPPSQVEFDDIIYRLLEDFGDEGAFDALLLALDHGYSADQLIDATLTGRLLAEGRVVRRDGGFEDPAGEPLGLFGAIGASSPLGRPAGGPSVEGARENTRSALRIFDASGIPEDTLPGVILLLLARGYSPAQVLDGLTTGTVVLVRDDVGNLGAGLRGTDGDLVPPDNVDDEPFVPFDFDYDRPPCNFDGIIDEGEECDGDALRGLTCESLGLSPGELKCSACELDDRLCRAECGNGTRESGEECEGSDFGIYSCELKGFDRGDLQCTADCRIDTSGCEELCGNGEIDSEFSERCDGANLGGQTCVTKGFASGELRCSDRCYFVTANCEPCGNGRAQLPEDCDGDDLRATCESLGFPAGGDLSCTDACTWDTSACEGGTCGDGQVEGDEDCDGSNLAGETCVSQGFEGGSLACTSGCAFDDSGCIDAGCGDGSIDPGEACDGAELAGATCESEGFSSGVLRCDPGCQLDTSGCLSAGCGDEIVDIQSGEECDGSNLNGQTCVGLGLASGDLACDSCRFDISGCGECGNGEAEGGEECDGADLGGATCEDFEDFTGGDLTCTAGCEYDTSACTSGGSCGDQVVDDGEACDGTNLGGLTTCDELDPQTYFGGPLACADCQFDVSGCELDESPVITDLQFPTLIDGFFGIGAEGTLDFADPNGDIVLAVLDVVSGNVQGGSADPGIQGQTSGTLQIALFCPNAVPADVTVEWHLVDSNGNESNRWRHSYRCEE